MKRFKKNNETDWDTIKYLRKQKQKLISKFDYKNEDKVCQQRHLITLFEWRWIFDLIYDHFLFWFLYWALMGKHWWTNDKKGVQVYFFLSFFPELLKTSATNSISAISVNFPKSLLNYWIYSVMILNFLLRVRIFTR